MSFHWSRLSNLNVRTVHGIPTSNTFAIYGQGVDKELTDLVPGIINQLGPDSLASLRKLAESYQLMQGAQGAQAQAAGGNSKDDDDDVPDVVSRQTSPLADCELTRMLQAGDFDIDEAKVAEETEELKIPLHIMDPALAEPADRSKAASVVFIMFAIVPIS